jgi:hypothetical protein
MCSRVHIDPAATSLPLLFEGGVWELPSRHG